jgi:CheY-like chemotaxis protein/nitrogen-specific signal transduction histidine kinase
MFRAGGFMAKARRRVSRRKARKRRPPARKSHAIEVVLAGLAHDIRTPLTGILALSQLLQASDLPKREQGWAEAIRGAADHLARLTTLVVDAAKADATGLVLRDEPFSPQELAQSVAKSLAARAQVKALDVDIDIAKRLPGRISGDEVRLRSALENLVDNAVKFTERGSIGFAVSTAALGSGRMRLTFTVTDSGMGITSADLKRLFRPFAQASAEVARRYGGAGLGLVLVKRIAKAMGGDLVVTSKPGRGSTFRLTVVMNSAAPAVRRRVTRDKPSASLRVLSVEDNPYGRIVHSAVLRELGHTVSFVGSGEAAVETVARNEHDVVLMDVALSGIDGIEATRRIRALAPPAGRIPIIGLSGRTEPRDAAAAKAAGMNDYLRKPASPAELNEALRSVAGLKRA